MTRVGRCIAATAIAAALLCFGALADGEISLECDYVKSDKILKASVTFVVLDEEGAEVCKTSFPDAEMNDNAMSVTVSEGVIESVTAEKGGIEDLNVSGARAEFVWRGSLIKNEKITITVSDITAETPEETPLTISFSEGLKLLHAAGVQVDENVVLTGATYTPLDAEPAVLTKSESGLAGFTLSAGDTAATLRLEYERAGQPGAASMALDGFEVAGGEEALEIVSDGNLCLLTLHIGADTAYRVVDAGETAGALPVPEGDFAGWAYADGAIAKADSVFVRDTELTAVFSSVTGYAGSNIKIMNPDGALLDALREKLGYIDAESLRIRLEGQDKAGNEDYYGSGWSDGGEYYVVSNCTAVSNIGGAYDNTHIPINEIRGITACAISGYSRVESFIPLDELEIELDKDGSAVITVAGAGPFLELETQEHFAYMNGRSSGVFDPDSGITRAEAAAIFYRCLTGSSRGSLTEQRTFSDVYPGSWYYEAVTVMAGAGVLNGYGDGSFRPNAGITRAEFVTIAVRLAGGEGNYGVNLFSDISASWARGYINAAARLGIAGGYEDGTFRPDKGITRAEAAKLVNALLGRSGPVSAVAGTLTWDDVPVSAWYFSEVQEATNAHSYFRDEDGEEIWMRLG